MNLKLIFFFWFRGHLFGYFDKHERLRDFGTTLSSRLTKKLWKPKKRRICWNFQNGSKIEHRIKGCWDMCLVWQNQKTVRLLFLKMRKNGSKILNTKFSQKSKSHYIYPWRFPEFFLRIRVGQGIFGDLRNFDQNNCTSFVMIFRSYFSPSSSTKFRLSLSPCLLLDISTISSAYLRKLFIY